MNDLKRVLKLTPGFFKMCCWFIPFLSFSGAIYPQAATQLPHGNLLNFVPPSPSAAALGKFGDIPVSFATGIPNISIPVYSYSGKSNGLNLNISLDYHAGGIRVEEKASNVGIGWALNAGGVITRTLRGTPDETGYWSQGPLPDVSNYLGGSMNAVAVTDPVYQVYTNALDPEPDVFSFNFAGKSGRFVIGKNGQVLIFPQQQLKISTANTSTGISFTIISDDGTTYVFDQQESAQYMNLAGAPISYGNAWYPSKIIAPFGMGEIDFSYNAISTNYKVKLPQSYFKCSPSTPDGEKQASSLTSLSNQGNRPYQALQLQKISFPDNTSVSFMYNPVSRCDVPGDFALNNIVITDGVNTKGFKLGQNYSFLGYTGTESNSCTGVDETATRLVLHQVTEYTGSTQNPPYVIQYNTTEMLPSTFSFAQDHWGFYNGVNNNQSLLPPDGTVSFYTDPSTNQTQNVDNADRTTYPGYPEAGTINQLSYPTGGYTSFTFESNDMPAQNSTNYVAEGAYASINGMESGKSFLFTIVKPVSYTTTTFQLNFAGISGANSNCSINVYLTSVDGTVSYGNTILGPGVGYTQSITATIPPGQYKCTYAYEAGSQCSPDLYVVSLNWNNIVLPPVQSINYVGGLRIQSIADYDGINPGPVKVKNYKYLNGPGNSSSGMLAITPVYSYNYNDRCSVNYCGSCAPYNANYNVINSTSLYTLANYLGSPIIYSRVEEDLVGNGGGNQGKTIREYTNVDLSKTVKYPGEALSPGNFTFPFITPEQPEWGFGQLLTDSVFDSNNNVKHTINNSYTFPFYTLPSTIENPDFIGLKVILQQTYYNTESGSCSLDPMYYLSFNQYFPYSGISLLAGSIEKEYDPSGNVASRSTNYTYNPTYNYISSIGTYSSKGDTIVQKLYFPYDYSIGGATQSLLNANCLTSLVSKEVWRKDAGTSSNRLCGSEVIEYGTFNNLIKPSRQHFFTSPQPLDSSVIGAFNPSVLIRNTSYITPEIQFDNYDPYGNVIQQHKVNDLNHCYLWDYNHTYPICETVNADSSNIAYTSFEADGTGNWTIPDTTRNRTVSMTGSRSYVLNASNTISRSGLNAGNTYIVSYWSANGGLNVNGTAGAALNSVGAWTYYEHVVTGAATISVSGSATIDELRLYPKNALMTTYTYSPLLGMTSQCTPASYISFYTYDGFGRLKTVKDLRGNIVKTFDYNYQGQ